VRAGKHQAAAAIGGENIIGDQAIVITEAKAAHSPVGRGDSVTAVAEGISAGSVAADEIILDRVGENKCAVKSLRWEDRIAPIARDQVSLRDVRPANARIVGLVEFDGKLVRERNGA